VECGEQGVCLNEFAEVLQPLGIESVMVEGGSHVLTSFLREQWVDYMLVTIAPAFIGGTSALQPIAPDMRGEVEFPRLKNIRYNQVGEDIVLEGIPEFRS